MIHQLLNLTRPLFVLDAETTGLNVRTARILELGFQRWEAEGMTLEWKSFINPGIPIPESAAAIHGITNDMMLLCTKCQLLRGDCTCQDFHVVPYFKQLAHNLAKGLSDCDFAGKNPRFDLRILDNEFRRSQVEWSYAGACIVDIDRLEALAHPRDLSSLHEKYIGNKHDNAHGVLPDVRASANVIVKQLETHTNLPRNLSDLHTAQWPGWLTIDGSVRLVNGVATLMFGKHRDTALKDVPHSYFDWILSNNFSADLKAIASEAKMGRYPS